MGGVMQLNELTVVNKHYGHQPDRDRKIYIGRGSPLGNPYPITPERSREEAIEAYEHHLALAISEPFDDAICAALNDIAGKVADGSGQPVELICFCKPHVCHGDIIKKFVLEAIKETS